MKEDLKMLEANNIFIDDEEELKKKELESNRDLILKDIKNSKNINNYNKQIAINNKRKKKRRCQ